MNLVTAKLIALDKAESFLAFGWPANVVPRMAEQARSLRREIAHEIIAHYDELKRQDRSAVAAVVNSICQHCHTEISPENREQLTCQEGVPCCRHCGRFLYISSSLPPADPVNEKSGKSIL